MLTEVWIRPTIARDSRFLQLFYLPSHIRKISKYGVFDEEATLKQMKSRKRYIYLPVIQDVIISLVISVFIGWTYCLFCFSASL